jgi:hypothetical protein
MGEVQTLHVSSLQTVGGAIGGSLRFTFLAVLYFIVFAAGGSLVAPCLPATPAQAGPVPELTGLLIVCAAFLPANASHIHHRSMANSVSAFAYINMGGWRLSDQPGLSVAIVANGATCRAGAQRAAKYRSYPAELIDPAEQCAHEPFDRDSLVHVCFWLDRDMAVVPKYVSNKS